MENVVPPEDIASAKGPDLILKRTTAVASAAGVFIALMVLVGWETEWLLLARVSPSYVPMTISIAISVLLLSAAVLLRVRPLALPLMRALPRALAVVVLIMYSWILVESVLHTGLDIEGFLHPSRETSEGYPLAQASPISSLTMILASFALILALSETARPQLRGFASSFLGLVVFSVGLVITLGYAYGSPLLYGGDVRPVSLLSGVCFSLLGLELMLMQGSHQWPTRLFVGQTVEARLLRAFLPLVVFVVLVSGSLSNRILSSSSNPALTASIIAVLTAIAVGYAVSRLSHSVGGQIDHANDLRSKAEEELRQANKKLNVLGSITRHDALNQLAVVLGRLELLKVTNKDPAVLKQVDESLAAANAIHTMLLFTAEYQKIGVSGAAWVDIDSAFRAGLEGVRLGQIEVKSEVGGLHLLADGMLGKVLANLVENSVRHGQRVKTIRVSYRVIEDGLVLVYEDDGVGLTEAEKANLFKRGFGKHTGYGMYLSREILRFTGFDVRETGEPGSGARFEIAVPAGRYRFS